MPRVAVLDWVNRCGALLIEDDYHAECRYGRAPTGAMQGYRMSISGSAAGLLVAR